MSENTAGERVILCDASSPQSGTDRPYFIGYGDMVDGYRHAWTETSRAGRKTLRHGRDFGHPADPRCPECHPDTASTPDREEARDE